jgi:hypothetical protein
MNLKVIYESIKKKFFLGGCGIEPVNPIPIKISSQNQLYKNQVKNYFFKFSKAGPTQFFKNFFGGGDGIEPVNPIPIQISSQINYTKSSQKLTL